MADAQDEWFAGYMQRHPGTDPGILAYLRGITDNPAAYENFLLSHPESTGSVGNFDAAIAASKTGQLQGGNYISDLIARTNLYENIDRAVTNPLSFSTGGLLGGESGVAQFDSSGAGVKSSSLTGGLSNQNVRAGAIAGTIIAAPWLGGGEAGAGEAAAGTAGGASTGAVGAGGTAAGTGAAAGTAAGTGASVAGTAGAAGAASGAVPWGNIIQGGVGLAGAALGAGAASDAAKLGAGATDRATALQREQFLAQQEAQAPWRQTGVNALSSLSQGIGIGEDTGAGGYGDLTRYYTLADIENDPIYQQSLAQGLKTGTTAIDRMASARGSYGSGARLKALTEYGQGLAASEGMNAYNRFTQGRTNKLSALQTAAGYGPAANAALGSAGSSYASNVGNLAMQNAATQGQAGIAQANLYGSALTGIGSSLGDWYQSQQKQQTTTPAPQQWTA